MPSKGVGVGASSKAFANSSSNTSRQNRSRTHLTDYPIDIGRPVAMPAR